MNFSFIIVALQEDAFFSIETGFGSTSTLAYLYWFVLNKKNRIRFFIWNYSHNVRMFLVLFWSSPRFMQPLEVSPFCHPLWTSYVEVPSMNFIDTTSCFRWESLHTNMYLLTSPGRQQGPYFLQGSRVRSRQRSEDPARHGRHGPH